MEDDQSVWEQYVKSVTPLGSHRPATGVFVFPFRKPSIPSEIDLHGLTTQEAFHTTLTYLARAKDHHRSVIIITGKSGTIRREFPHWIVQRPEVKQFEITNGNGAFRIFLRFTGKNYKGHNHVK